MVRLMGFKELVMMMLIVMMIIVTSYINLACMVNYQVQR